MGMTQSMDAPAISALAPWFGGKRTLAPVIVEELGGHRAYFEPFCGGCSTLWQKPTSSHETVNDLHGDLINLAMVLASDRWADLYNRLRRTLCCEAIFRQARARIDAMPHSLPTDLRHVRAEDVERAWAFFVMAWDGLPRGPIATLR